MIKAKAISGSVLPTHPTKLLRDRGFPGEAELNFVLNGIVERNAAGTYLLDPCILGKMLGANGGKLTFWPYNMPAADRPYPQVKQ